MANNTETRNVAGEDDGPLVWLAFYSEEEGREYYYEPNRRIATWIMPDSYHPYPNTETTENNGAIKDEENQPEMNDPKSMERMSVSFSCAVNNDDEKDEFSAESGQKSRGLDFGAGEIAEQNTHSRWSSLLPRRIFSVITVILVGGVIVIVSLRGGLVQEDSFLSNTEENGTLHTVIPVSHPTTIDVSDSQNTIVRDASENMVVGSAVRPQYAPTNSGKEKKAEKNAPNEVAESNVKLRASKKKSEKVQITQPQHVASSTRPKIEQKSEEPIVMDQIVDTGDSSISQKRQNKVEVKRSNPASPKQSKKVPENVSSQKEEAEEEENYAENIIINDDEDEHISYLLRSSKKMKSRGTKKDAKHFKKCLVPLAYLVSSKCRQEAKEHPIFDLQSLVDSLME